ncbi:hypothetical protein [Tropicibacter sp. Alg240-R139]|uniref:hypothetical protein n=1 Tax=Tropicibacter sp. Alg240-R139 TaxID=2305991 RepID=UPI001F07EDF2|nr:hypothetical protein [Tropicibacter sp. Alg240-R139]
MTWPLVCVALFRRLPIERAIIWSILGGYLILPPVAEFDLPLIPSMNKDSIAALSAMLGCLFVARKPVSFWPKSWSMQVLLAAFMLVVIPTVLTNREPMVFEVLAGSEPIRFITNYLPGMSVRDLLSVTINQIIVLLPFFLAMTYLSSESGLREIIVGLAIAGLVYSIPSLLETVISPLINIYVYGFFQHDFRQMIRDGGFRPIVFLPHGLWLAFFMVTALLSAAALARASKDKARLYWGGATLYLLIVLNACKSLASLSYGLVLTPVMLLLGERTKIALALVLATTAITYPMLRNFGVIPLDAIVVQAEEISPARAQSLEYRFNNEEQMLDRAHEKPWFGWGGWGRNLVRHSETADILTVPDGSWIIVFGTFGWVGYIAQMGLLAGPILLLFAYSKLTPRSEFSPYVAPIAIILAATMMDMLLNATLTPFTWLCAGAVLGYAERLRFPAKTPEKETLFGKGPVIGQPVRSSEKRSLL